MIKVVYTLPNFNTAGSGKAMLNIALGLNRDEFEPHIVCNSEKGDFFQVVKKSGIPVHVIDYIPNSRPISKLISESYKTSKFYRSMGADIVHSFHYSDNYSEALAVRLSGAKWVFTKKNMSWGGKSSGGWKLRSKLANGIAVQNTDMIKQFYPNSKKINLIPRGVVVENFMPQTSNPEIKHQMDTTVDERIIICVANMVPVKGVELLIDAFESLSTKYEGWKLWLIGDIENDYGKSLVQKVKVSDLGQKVKFSGKQPNVREYLDHAEIFVLPTKDEGRREGSPVALLEAMANGKVVIGSAVPGVKDQLADFEDHQFEPGNSDSLKNRLAVFMNKSESENKEIGKKFQNQANQNHQIEQEIKKHEEFYKSVL